MYHAVQIEFFNQRQAYSRIKSGRFQKFFTQSSAEFFNRGIHGKAHYVKADFAHQRKAVGMYTGRRQAQKHVARFNFFAGNHFAFFYHTYAESCNIVFVLAVQIAHFGSFAANQCAAGFFAGVGNALNNLGNLFGFQSFNSDIIEEEQRFSALHENIVYAHGNGVLADGIMFVSHKSQFQFGAYTVGAANQNRFFVFAAV